MKKFFIILSLLALLLQPAFALENIKVGTSTRTMISYAPNDLPENAPLFISMHGAGQDAPFQQNYAKLESLADTAKFVVVYPNGINNYWDISGNTDITFIETIIDTMYSRHHINRNRVYLSGFSMGGMMTYYAATKIANKIAAFAPVSGYPFGGGATASRPVPIIHTHGTGDDVVGFSGVQGYLDKWINFNGCNKTPTTIKPYPAGKTSSCASRTTWTDGKDGVEVVLITLEGKGHWYSMDPVSALTSVEIWNFCKRYSLGPEEPVAPTVVKVEPENNSFDLPVTTDSFAVTFNGPVDASKVEAALVTDSSSFNLHPLETAFSKTLTFVLPSDTLLPEGNCTLTVSNIVNEKGGVLKSCSFTYQIGFTEITENWSVDTLLTPQWGALQSTVGEGIPVGWRRLNNSADGSKDEQVSGAANTGGARLKYFPQGGDFDAGFYFSSRNFDNCHLYYGEYDGYRLHLKRGTYTLSFRSTYWNSGAESNSITYSVSLLNLQQKSVWSRNSLASSGCLNELTSERVSGSYQHSYTITIETEGDYVLDFMVSAGWNGLILGGIEFTSQPSVAGQYKVALLRALAAGRALYEVMGDELYVLSEPLREELKKTLEGYASFAATTPSAYTAAIKAVQEALNPLQTRKANVDNYIAALDSAQNCISRYASIEAIVATQAYKTLSNACYTFSRSFVSLARDADMEKAARILTDYTAKFVVVATSVRPLVSTPVSVEYYDLLGRRLYSIDSQKIVMVRQLFSDGTVRTHKIVQP